MEKKFNSVVLSEKSIEIGNRKYHASFQEVSQDSGIKSVHFVLAAMKFSSNGSQMGRTQQVWFPLNNVSPVLDFLHEVLSNYEDGNSLNNKEDY